MKRTLALVFAATVAAAPAAAEPPEREMRPVDLGLIYPEGTVFDGNVLLLADMKRGSVMRLDGDEVVPVWHDDTCGPTSLARLPSGLWLVACHESHELVFLDLHDLNNAQAVARTPFRRPNDMYADANGVYVGRSGEFSQSARIAGEVWLVRAPDDLRRVATRIHYANGVAVARDRHGLLVCEHLEHRVWRYVIEPDGTLGERTLFFDLGPLLGPRASALDGPDGIEPASDGSVYLAVYGRGFVLHIGANGEVIERFTVPGYPKLTNVALTPDGTGLYAVSSAADERKGGLFHIDLVTH